MPRRGTAYAIIVGLVALAAALFAATEHSPTGEEWTAFTLLLPLAALASLFRVAVGRNHTLNTAPAFIVAGTLVLPPSLVVALVIGLHVPVALLRVRYPWYIQLFNVANYSLSALGAWLAVQLVGTGSDVRFAAAGLAAAAAFVIVNHVLLAMMLSLGRGHRMRETGLFSASGLGTEFVLGVLGVAVGDFAIHNPWLLASVIAPLLLAHRSLSTLALLRESEERFRTMFESAPTATMLHTIDGKIIAANRSAEALLGYSEDELRGTPTDALRHESHREEGRRLFGELVRGERDTYRHESHFVTKDASTVVTELAVALVRDADGKPEYVIGMAEDVSERRILEEQLRQSQKLDAVGRLAGGVAHDFNNMLTAISGYTAFALEHAEDGSTLRSDLDEIRKATDRATLLTRQLLAFSRKQVLETELIDLNEIITEMEAMLRPLIGADVVLTTALDPALGPIVADPGQLNQVVMNLVVNAADAMPTGGSLSIETANAEVGAGSEGTIDAGSYVTLSVRDEGEGIDEETLRQIFEPFFTTKDSGKGTGLGLATVYGIVKQSGGYLEVESEVGVGSLFRIYLPLADASSRPAQPEAPAPPAVERVDPATVLVVEDEEVVRSLVVQVLEGEGYKALVARDGEDALALAEERHVDLLLTDLTMPKIGGRELAERLRSTHPSLKVVYMSGYVDGDILSDGVLPPGTAFLSKPFTFADLAEKVRDLL
jgi:PAS domain S-box-containing protein